MAQLTGQSGMAMGRRGRTLLWGGVAALLLLPAVAMQFTAEVQWTAFDFAAFAGLLLVPAVLLELAVRRSASLAYRAGVALALAAAFLLTWANLAVGLIGNENNPANQMFSGLVLLGLAGGALARFRAAGLAITMMAVAAAQLLAGAVGSAQVYDIWPVTLIFSALWLGAAWLFARASRAGG